MMTVKEVRIPQRSDFVSPHFCTNSRTNTVLEDVSSGVVSNFRGTRII